MCTPEELFDAAGSYAEGSIGSFNMVFHANKKGF